MQCQPNGHQRAQQQHVTAAQMGLDLSVKGWVLFFSSLGYFSRAGPREPIENQAKKKDNPMSACDGCIPTAALALTSSCR